MEMLYNFSRQVEITTSQQLNKSGESPVLYYELMTLQEYTHALTHLEQVMNAFQAIAIIFNVNNIVVLTRKNLRSPTTRYSVALSFIQLFYVALSLVSTLNNLVRPGPKLNDLFYLVYSLFVGNYVMVSIRRCIYCLRSCVSLERFLAVATPLKARQFLVVRNPLFFIFAAPIVVFIASIHVCFKVEVFEVKSDNNTLSAFRYTSVYLQHQELFDNISVALKFLFEYGLLALVLTLSVCTILLLRGYSRQRTKLNTNVRESADHRRDRQMTITILASTSLFVLLCLPAATNSAVYNALPEGYGPFSLQRYIFFFLQDFGGACFVLAFSVDFFTYFALSSMYRNTFLDIYRIVKRK